jgi:DNA polymerase-3 subunit epsilon
MRKMIYLDTETTGLDPARHELTQLAYIIEVDGECKVERSMNMRPLHPETIEEAALLVQGRTREQLDQFQHPFAAYTLFIEDLAAHVDKYNREDKLTPCAYNGRFDLDFLKAWFLSLGDQYFGSWQNWRLVDPMSVCYWLAGRGQLSLPDYKLATVARHFGVDTGVSHDALSDVRALRGIVNVLNERLVYNADAQ